MRYQNNSMKIFKVKFILNSQIYTNSIRASSYGPAEVRIKAALRDLFGADGNYEIISLEETKRKTNESN